MGDRPGVDVGEITGIPALGRALLARGSDGLALERLKPLDACRGQARMHVTVRCTGNEPQQALFTEPSETALDSSEVELLSRSHV